MKKSNSKTSEQIAMETSVNSIILNVILSIYKLLTGIFTHSNALISDSLHSASDVFSTFIVIIGVKISNKDSDENHQYGHERLECVASIILAVILFATGLGIGYAGLKKVIHHTEDSILVSGAAALTAAVISIIVKEAMYWYTRNAALKINSSALMADAWHHRSDSLSSIGSFAGILGAQMGIPYADPIASVVISLFIIKAAFDIFKDSVYKLTDVSCDESIVEEMKEIIMAQDGVLGLDDIKTRIFGSKIYMDIEILADGSLSLEEAHQIAEAVHDAVESAFPTVKHCTVHVNPL